MAAKKRYYSDLKFVDDVCELLIKRIQTLIDDRKKAGRAYLEIDYNTFNGKILTHYRVMQDKVVEHFKSRGYRIGYGLAGDKMEISWPA